MHFCTYKPLWKNANDFGSAEEAYKIYQEAIRRGLAARGDNEVTIGLAEYLHEAMGKPYYQVYPCVLELCEKLKDDTPVALQPLPEITTMDAGEELPMLWNSTIELRLPRREDLPTAMLLSYSWGDCGDPGEKTMNSIAIVVQADFGDSRENYTSAVRLHWSGDGEVLRDMDPVKNPGKYVVEVEGMISRDWAIRSWALCTRLAVLLPMLVDAGADLLERDVLNRDRGKPVTDAVLRRAAARKGGKGWTLGKALEEVPSVRRPHWAHRWMRPGPGQQPLSGDLSGLPKAAGRGLIPVLRPIKGSVIKGEKVGRVPHGYGGR